jgi:hypothetical protein
MLTVNKKLARAKADNLVGRHSAVRAANPEKLWCLCPAEALKVLWIFELDSFGPDAVILKKFWQEFYWSFLCKVVPDLRRLPNQKGTSNRRAVSSTDNSTGLRKRKLLDRKDSIGPTTAQNGSKHRAVVGGIG